MSEIEVQQERVIEAVRLIMDTCQDEGFSELESYMAMISITNTMEEKLGFSHKRNTND